MKLLKITVVETDDGDWAVQLPKGRIVVDIVPELDSDVDNYRKLAKALARVMQKSLRLRPIDIVVDSRPMKGLGWAIRKAMK